MANLDDEDMNELRESFAYNDGNNDGRIDFDEFCAMLDMLEAGMTRAECRVGFDEVDADNDGAIGFQEFAEWWTANG